MISLAGRDILHSWGKFVFTGVGLGLLIGVTLSMAGIYRGMVDDAQVMLDNTGADLWVVQQGTQGPYAESSSLYDDLYRSLLDMPGVEYAANVTYLIMQVGHSGRDVSTMVVGIMSGGPGTPGQPRNLVAGSELAAGVEVEPHVDAVLLQLRDPAVDFAKRFRIERARVAPPSCD